MLFKNEDLVCSLVLFSSYINFSQLHHGLTLFWFLGTGNIYMQ